jgi:transcriptional regulator GlxA family with amidase domain
MNIVIPLYDNFTALDVIGPYEVLGKIPGTKTTFVGRERRVYRSDTPTLGIEAEAAFADIDSADLLLVGGTAHLAQVTANPPLIEFVRRIHATTTWTASACTGALALASAGLLAGVEAVTHWSAMDLLGKLGAIPVHERVVIRGKIATAAGVSAGIDMALALAAKIAGEPLAKALQLALEYDPQPPFDAGSAQKAGPELVKLVTDLMAPALNAPATP